MAKKNTETVELDDGTEIETADWSEANDKTPVLLKGWKPGAGSHHGISLGMALACKDKVPGAYVGDYNGVPVMDPLAINEAMEEAFIKAYDLDVVRVVGSRNGSNAKVEAIRGAITAEDIEKVRAFNPAAADAMAALLPKK